VWLLPAWFLLLSGAVALVSFKLSGQLPLWLAASEIGGLLLAVCIAWGVVRTSRRLAFFADQHGVLLGSRRERRRQKHRQVYLPWSDIAQVCMVPRRYGVLVALVLSHAAPPVYRPSLGRQGWLLLGAMVMPIGVGRGRPALTMPRLRPPSYRVRICEQAHQVGDALQLIAPDNVPVRMLNGMAALRLASPRPQRLARDSQSPDTPRWLGQYVPSRLPVGSRRR
jgi:hypothetical protein